MLRLTIALNVLFVGGSPAFAQQAPSFSKEVRPFLAKYCLECHNAREMKAGLNLETYQAIMEGSDRGAVIEAGKPDASLLVRLCEGKEKPLMPPKKAKFHPKKEEIALVRAWIAAGAKDDSGSVKVALPMVKPRRPLLPPVTALVYSAGRKQLFIARNEELTLLDFTDGSTKTYAGTKTHGIITALAENARGDLAATVCAWSQPGQGGNAYRLSDSNHLSPLLPGHKDAILDLAIDPQGRWLASASYDTQIQLKEWNSATTSQGKKGHVLKEHSDAVYGIAFSPDGSRLASVSADRAMKVWDVEAGKLLYTLGEATDWLYAVAWSPDGKYLASGGVDKSIRVYQTSANGAKLRKSVFAHEGPIQKLVFASDSRTLYSVGQDRVIKAWDVARMIERKVYEPQPETVLCLVLREAAQQIIAGRYDGVVQLLDMKTGKVVQEIRQAKTEKKAAALAMKSSFVSVGQAQDPAGKSAQSLQATNAGNSPTSAQKVTTPATILGTLDRAGAVHYFRFEAAKGQELGVHLLAKEIGSKLEAVLVLTDMSGRLLAESNAGQLGHTFAAAGSYAIGVHDRDYRGGVEFKYRLNLGTIPVVTAVHPLGLQRGTKHRVRVEGVFLDQQEVDITVPPDAPLGSTVAVPVTSKHGKPVGAASIVVGEFTDVFEPDVSAANRWSIPVPGTANGRILHDGDKHTWSFHAHKGQHLIVEVYARRLGARLDSFIEILDKNNQPVPRAVLRSQAKTYVTFRDHDSAGAGIRIEAWSELSTNDFLYVGNELMKIQSLPTHPDADCIFFSAGGQRLAYLDTTPTHHSNNSPMYKVGVHPPGTTFPPNGYPVFTLYYRNDDGGPGYGRDSRILFDPPADGEYRVRIADTRGMGGVNFGYQLTVRPPRPSFNVRFTPSSPVVSNGSAIPLTISADRLDGYDGPIDVHFADLPSGFSAPPTIIEAGTFSTAVALHAEATAKLPAKAMPFKVIGEAVIDGKKQTKEAAGAMPKLIEPGDLVTVTDEAEVSIKPGQQTKLTVHIERRNGFTGRVPLDVRGLPHGVRVLDIGLNGILINERETVRTVVLYAEPWVQAARHPFVVLARREGKNTEHAAKSVLLKVK